MLSSSKGRAPQRRAYNVTPQLHTSTSGPAYNLSEITYKKRIEHKLCKMNRERSFELNHYMRQLWFTSKKDGGGSLHFPLKVKQSILN